MALKSRKDLLEKDIKTLIREALQERKPEKALRNKIKRWLKKKTRGLPPGFIFKVSAYKRGPYFTVTIEVPAWAEANPIRAHQLDLLVAELESEGIRTNVFYQEDLTERDFLNHEAP
ncbi:hypothetical protein [Thermosulfuriphilus sp.]